MSEPVDPFESLAEPADPVEPRPEFARSLRRTLSNALGNPAEVPLVDLPERTSTMTITASDAHTSDLRTPTAGARKTPIERNGRIWPAVMASDAPAMIRFAVDVLGFTEQIVVPGDEQGVVVHSQLAWPEGGVVQIATGHRSDGNPFSEQPIGSANVYVVTDDPQAVHDRCIAAGVEIVREMESPDYDPGGSGFGLRDPEGNLWSFGTYAGE